MNQSTESKKAQRAFVGMSHSPLLGLNPLDPQVQADVDEAIARVRQEVHDFDPELVVLIGPDHYNGFFNDLMPPFCIGSTAQAVGDFLTPAGELRVDPKNAVALADHLMNNGFDIAMSRRMLVDHGFAQALQFLWGDLDRTPPIIPIFMNAVAAPVIPRLRRCLDLGRQIGAYIDGLPGRILVIGSGGLSHDPPVPTLNHRDPKVRERITQRRTWTEEDKAAKTKLVMAAGMALASGDAPHMKPLNPQWDLRWLSAMESGDLDSLMSITEAELEAQAGLSANESKTWLIARAAMPADQPLACRFRYYRAINELIAGYGMIVMRSE